MEEDREPDSFSLKSAKQCLESLFKALPKTKQRNMIGEYNEIAVVLGRVPCADRSREYNPS